MSHQSHTLYSSMVILNNLLIPLEVLDRGDPLSHYLFIMCAEALSKLIQVVEDTRAITGVPLARNKMHISHLFFADHSLLFCKANSLEWSRLIQVLDTYEHVSGQRLNKEKTSIFFSKNTSKGQRDYNSSG